MQQLLDPKVTSWIKNYKTEKTREAAWTSYKSLQRYLSETDQKEEDWIESMKAADDTKYHNLSDMINYALIEFDLQPASLKQYYWFWKGYLRFVYQIKTYHEDAIHIIKLPTNIKRLREPLTHENIKKLCKQADDIQRAEYLVLSSSGMRMNEFLRTPKENFNFDSGMVSIAGKSTKTQVERKTFISSEAIESIEKLGSLFWEKRKYHDEATYFWRLREKTGLIETYDDSVVHKITLHSFRSFTRTQAGMINKDFGEQLIGHGYLQYVRIPDKDMKKYYEKLEPKLRIF